MGTLREYLIANMLDGDESGIISFPATSFLDEVCENVTLWLIEQSGVPDRIEAYYEPPYVPESVNVALPRED